MALDNRVPDIAFIKKINESSIELLTEFKYNKKKEIKFIKAGFLKIGSPVGSVRLLISSNSDIANTMYVSEFVNIEDVEKDLFGDVRFDFDRVLTKENVSYFLFAEIVDYISDDNNYFGFTLDYPMPVNEIDSSESFTIPARIEILAR